MYRLNIFENKNWFAAHKICSFSFYIIIPNNNNKRNKNETIQLKHSITMQYLLLCVPS